MGLEYCLSKAMLIIMFKHQWGKKIQWEWDAGTLSCQHIYVLKIIHIRILHLKIRVKFRAMGVCISAQAFRKCHRQCDLCLESFCKKTSHASVFWPWQGRTSLTRFHPLLCFSPQCHMFLPTVEILIQFNKLILKQYVYKMDFLHKY